MNPRTDETTLEEPRHGTAWDGYWSRARGTERPGLYERFAECYRRQFISRFGAHMLATYLRNESGRHYLHAGCGSGGSDQRLTFDLPTFHELDYSMVALQMNRERTMAIRRRFLCGDLLALPYRSETIDGIFNFGVMEHFDEEAIGRILAEFRRVLKPDGHLVIFWPPAFGLSVLVLSSWLGIVNRFRREPLRLYPDEVSRLKSFGWVRQLMARHGFRVIRTQFGWRDLFTQVGVVATKA
jgi:SAM-dependent methyltransferase